MAHLRGIINTEIKRYCGIVRRDENFVSAYHPRTTVNSKANGHGMVDFTSFIYSWYYGFALCQG